MTWYLWLAIGIAIGCTAPTWFIGYCLYLWIGGLVDSWKD